MMPIQYNKHTFRLRHYIEFMHQGYSRWSGSHITLCEDFKSVREAFSIYNIPWPLSNCLVVSLFSESLFYDLHI